MRRIMETIIEEGCMCGREGAEVGREYVPFGSGGYFFGVAVHGNVLVCAKALYVMTCIVYGIEKLLSNRYR